MLVVTVRDILGALFIVGLIIFSVVYAIVETRKEEKKDKVKK